MDKKKVLKIAALVNYLIWIAVIINIVAVFPPTVANLWIYGIIIFATGISSTIIGLFSGRASKLVVPGTIIILAGEEALIGYLGLSNSFWISMYVVPPAITLLLLVILAKVRGSAMLGSKALNWAIMIVAAALFFLVVEFGLRTADLSQHKSIPTWAIIIIIAGFLLYVLTTWRVVEKPSYILALAGAFVINIGIILLEMYFQLAEATGIFMLLFVGPAAVFFILLLINYKRTPESER
jgi:hypothetical protein